MTEPTHTHRNLLADDAAQTRLPADPAAAELAKLPAGDDAESVEAFLAVVRAHPDSCLVWALLAEDALASEIPGADVAAYAYSRTGYHRGLDALRGVGWKGAGPVPWEHEPNRGFLRALWALSRAAQRIGEDAEQRRCAQFLRDSSATAYRELADRAGSPGQPGRR